MGGEHWATADRATGRNVNDHARAATPRPRPHPGMPPPHRRHYEVSPPRVTAPVTSFMVAALGDPLWR